MRGALGMLVAGVALLALVGVATASGSLIVSAGLDQDVVYTETVYLNGGGTHAPDGEVESMEWSVETPDGRTMTPECVDCVSTSFYPNRTGQYNVTLTARSASGIERSDMLHVTVAPLDERGTSPQTNVSSEDGGAGNSRTCWIQNEGNDGEPMHVDVCDEVGAFDGYEWMDEQRNIKGVVVENEGFAEDYSSARRRPDGTVVVPTWQFFSDTTALFENHDGDGDTEPVDRSDSPNTNGVIDARISKNDPYENNDANEGLAGCGEVPPSHCL